MSQIWIFCFVLRYTKRRKSYNLNRMAHNMKQDTSRRGADADGDAKSGDVRSVVRAISVLTAFEDAEEMSLAELAQHTGLPKPTVFRLALTLENAGFLTRSDEGHQFSLGHRLISVARLVLSRGLPALARPHMQALARAYGHTVNLAVLNGDEMLFIDV